MNTTRRNFIKSTVIASITFPYIGMGESNLKRHPNSLFTIQELRTWCEKNGFHYIEDEDIGHIKEEWWRTVDCGINGKRLLRSLPFLHNPDINKQYDLLKWLVIVYKIDYREFYLYDINETTLPFQKEKGEYYSLISCINFRYKNDSCKLEEQRLKDFKDNVYCIKDKCWYKPIQKQYYNGIWYNDGFERV